MARLKSRAPSKSGLATAVAAGRRHDSVHAQVDDHLSVVVHGVGDAEGGGSGARAFVFAERVEGVGGGDGVDRLVGVDVGILERLNDVVFAGELFDRGFVGRRADISTVEEFVTGLGGVLDLLAEGPDSGELALGGSEIVLIRRHGLGGADDFALHSGHELSVDLGGRSGLAGHGHLGDGGER
jgi:hypothetical protein